MNRAYTKIDTIYSNNRTFEGSFREAYKPHQSAIFGLRAKVVNSIRKLLSVLCMTLAKRLYRAIFAVGSVVGMLGLVGSLESGKISPIACLTLCAVLLFVLYLAVKPKKDDKNGQQN